MSENSPLDAFLKGIDRRLQSEYDGAVLVVGDEGVGKSTLMLELTGRFQERYRDFERTADTVLGSIVWHRRKEFKEALTERPTGSVINIPDAARVLHKKRAMAGDQVELEMDMLDVRTKNYFLMFGYQDWGIVPSDLAERRAHYCLRIPKRGVVEGYTRSQLDEKVEMGRGEWPDNPDFVDHFPDLAGTALWDAYVRRDKEAKDERMAAEKEPEPDDVKRREQTAIALRAVKPWSDSLGMTQTDVANALLDFSPSWVSKRVKAWKQGELEDLVEEYDRIEAPPKHIRQEASLQSADLSESQTEAD